MKKLVVRYYPTITAAAAVTVAVVLVLVVTNAVAVAATPRSRSDNCNPDDSNGGCLVLNRKSGRMRRNESTQKASRSLFSNPT